MFNTDEKNQLIITKHEVKFTKDDLRFTKYEIRFTRMQKKPNLYAGVHYLTNELDAIGFIVPDEENKGFVCYKRISS